jgi:MFS transporter, NNP family, nitrate/nitrite transporter
MYSYSFAATPAKGTHRRGNMSNLRSFIVLGVTTWAFVVCFAVWLMFGVIGIPIKNELGLNGTEFGLLTSTPVLTGALFRLPLGIWTDRFGGRIVMFVLLIVCAVPVWFASCELSGGCPFGPKRER